jgi:chromosome segregation ATPase
MAPVDNGSLVAPANRETGSPAPPPAEANPLASNGSIAALTAEVRQLRVAVEELAHSQEKAQTRTAVLSDQQERVERTTEQLQSIRDSIAGRTQRMSEIDSTLSSLPEELSLARHADRRQYLEMMGRELRLERSRIEAELQQARSQESELSRALQIEQRRWDDLVGGGR